ELEFTSFMPSMSWQLSDTWKMDLSYSQTKSDFSRDEPYILYYPSNKGTVEFDYNSGSIVPRMDYSQDLSLASIGWTATPGPVDGNEGWNMNPDLRFQRGSRETETEGFHSDFAWGEDPDRIGVKFGLAYDFASTAIQSYSGEYLDYLLSQEPDLLENFNDYVVDAQNTDLGTGISGYQGINGIAGINWDKFKEDTNYSAFAPSVNTGGGDQFGQGLGGIEETMLAAYGELNYELNMAGRPLRTNVGVRYVETEQTMTARENETNTTYDKVLPSMSLLYEVAEDVTLRFAVSQSLTRAMPSNMFPDASFNSNSISTARAGNPFLKPFESLNLDVGGEFYFSDLGFIAWNFYMKDMKNFTEGQTVAVPFTELGDWGIDTSTLTDVMQNELATCAPNCITMMETTVNANAVDLSGFELIWVQPLDFLVDGLGFNASANKLNQSSDDGTFINGVADSRSFTAYYENDTFQTRLTIYRQDGTDIGNIWGTTPFKSRARTQVDLTASYLLPIFSDYNLTLTFDAYNLTNEPMSTWLEDSSQTFNAYFPGTTYTFGVRAAF
ncbi:MAG TPA: TonB-dependent receptor, partial [Cellvibrionaceae bacterium]